MARPHATYRVLSQPLVLPGEEFILSGAFQGETKHKAWSTEFTKSTESTESAECTESTGTGHSQAISGF